MAGRLDDAESPYLRRAASQPIKWQRELTTGRPTLLVIGHPASHACAAFDDEVFDDPEVARAIDSRFAAVRVDADQRPDVDARFQWLAQDGGGWPLICLLDADGTPRRVLGRLPRARLITILDEPSPPPAEPRAISEQPDLARLIDDIGNALSQHGVGFGPPPRYPHAPALALLLAGSDASAALALRVIEAVSHGGIRDHLGGGFHRSSTDARWIVPHFEKLALDQAVMIDLLADRPEAHGARDQILDYVSERLALPGGGYASSEAADSGAYDDGSYYTWTVEQARAALPDATDFAIAQRRFDIFGKGELHSNPTRNVLFVAMPEPAVARELGLDPGEVARRLPSIIVQLRAARHNRPRPPLDTSIYVAASARLARACLAHARTRDHALATVSLLAARPSRGWLADEAQLGLAAHAAHDLGGAPGHAELARTCLLRVRELLVDALPWLACDTADASPIALAVQLALALGDTALAVGTVRAHLPATATLGVRGAGLLALAKSLSALT